MSVGQSGVDETRLKGRRFEMPKAGHAEHTSQIADGGITAKLFGESLLTLLERLERAICDLPVRVPFHGAAHYHDMRRSIGLHDGIKWCTVQIDEMGAHLLHVARL